MVNLKRRTYVLVGGLIGLWGLFLIGSDGVPGREDENTQELARVRSRISQIKQALDAMESQKSSLMSQLSDIERRYGESARVLRDVEEQASRQLDRLNEVKLQRDRLAQAIRNHQAALTGQVRAAHAMGRQERLKLILNQENPVRASRILAYYSYLSNARVAEIRTVRNDLQTLRLAEAGVLAESQRLQALLERRKTEQAALDQVRRSRQEVLAKLDLEMEDKKLRLATLEEDEMRLRDLVDSLHQALDDIPFDPGPAKPFDQMRGLLAWPLSGQVVERFGAKRATSRWDGVLIRAKEGADVHAVSRGRVAYADWLRGYGLLTIIDHGNGYMTLYAFNQSLYRSDGDWVEAGDVIASAGTSGGRAKSGLYFGIRNRGKAEDPAKWCRKERNGRVG